MRDKKITEIKKFDPYFDRKKVGIYCRISSAKREQIHSLANQVSFLTQYVMRQNGWLLIDIYIDVESGSNTENRREYNRMLSDVNMGKINFIVVKNISRFGRDVLEILTTTRELQSAGVGIFFHEQQISTLNKGYEFTLESYAIMAESDNYHLSENVKWGIRKKVEDGSSSFYNRTCYGYRMGDNGEFEIVDDEANVVRKIFNLYLSGASVLKIKRILELENISSPTGKLVWSRHTIETILSNKKYCGYSIIYKTYIKGAPSYRRTTNKGEHKMFEMEAHHVPIIPLEVFEQVQVEKQARSNIETDENGNIKRKSTKYSSPKNI